MPVCVCVCVCVHVCVGVSLCVCVCVCVSVYEYVRVIDIPPNHSSMFKNQLQSLGMFLLLDASISHYQFMGNKIGISTVTG